jgi:hypothetical protein
MAKIEQLTPEQMDNAGNAAREELQELMDNCKVIKSQPAMADIQDWWKKWYLIAGHRRLGRILMEIK